MTLHLVFSSPFTNSALKDCLAVMNPNDGILFIEDGSYITQNINLLPQTKNKYYVLSEDMSARGLFACPEINSINYDEFVALALEFTKTISWR